MEHIALSVVLGGLTTIGVVTGAYGIFAERAARNNWVALQAAELEILRLREMIRERDHKALESDAFARRRLMEVDAKRIELESHAEFFKTRLESELDASYYHQRKVLEHEKRLKELESSLEHQTKLRELYFAQTMLLTTFIRTQCLVQRPKSKWFAKIEYVTREGAHLQKDNRVPKDNWVPFKK